MKKSEKPVRIRQLFQSNSETIWEAITIPEKMRQWYFKQIGSFIAEPGFETRFDVQVDETIFKHCWKVMEVKKNKKISYEWTYSGFSGKGLVSFTLTEKKDNTSLTVLFKTLEDFPDEIPEFRRDSCMSGWKYFIQNSLKQYLDNT